MEPSKNMSVIVAFFNAMTTSEEASQLPLY
jgi:hypothetical protein